MKTVPKPPYLLPFLDSKPGKKFLRILPFCKKSGKHVSCHGFTETSGLCDGYIFILLPGISVKIINQSRFINEIRVLPGFAKHGCPVCGIQVIHLFLVLSCVRTGK